MISMSVVYYFLAFFIGLAIATQSAINNQLKSFLGSGVLLSAFVSFIVGCVFLFIACIASGERLVQLANLRHVNPVFLAGGALGAIFVFGTTFLAPRLGIATMITVVIFGQMAMSIIIDNYGLFGLPVRDVDPLRIFGVILVFVGAICVSLSSK